MRLWERKDEVMRKVSNTLSTIGLFLFASLPVVILGGYANGGSLFG